jgi:hypothetical protein
MYIEEQRFRQWWIWVIVVVVAAIGWWGFVQQIVLGEPFGNNPASDLAVWLLWVFIGLGLPLLFLFIRLTIEVTADEVVIRYRPLVKRRIPLADIEGVRARTYRAVREYGGWGIKGWSFKNVAYNVSGDRGVQLTLRDGRRVMLGSRHPDELAQAIETQRAARGPA